MKKRIFSILLALTMILTFMPAMAFATVNVAKVGETEYTTLSEAFSHAANGTVELLQNVEYADTITVNGKTAFVLNGHKAVYTGNSFAFKLTENTADLTVDGKVQGSAIELKNTADGIFEVNKKTKLSIVGTGNTGDLLSGNVSSRHGLIYLLNMAEDSAAGAEVTLTDVNATSNLSILTSYEDPSNNGDYFTYATIKVSGGDYKRTGTGATGANEKGFYFVASNATLENVTVTSNYGPAIEFSGSDASYTGLGTITTTSSSLKNCTVKVNDNTDTWYNSALALSWGANVTVDSGTYEGKYYGSYIFSSGGNLTINGGTFKGSKAAVQNDLSSSYKTSFGAAANTELKGGTFEGPIVKNAGTNIAVTGGIYSTDVSALIPSSTAADKTVAAKDEDGKYHVGVESKVAAATITKDGVTKYYTSTEAANKYKASDETVFTKLKIEFQKGDTAAGGTMDPVYTYKDWSYTLPECGFTAPTGKYFDGWKVNGVSAHAGDTVTITGNTTVIAQWTSSSGGSGGKNFDTIKSEALTEIGKVYASAYDKADQTAITNAITTATTAINNAKTATQIESALATFKSTIAQYKTTAKKLEEAKTSALAEINAVKPDDYKGDATAKAAVEKAISTAKTAVNAATTVDAVNTAMTTFRTEMAKYKTDAQKALEKSKSDAIAELDAIKLTSYQEPEKSAVKAAVEEAKTAINAATTTTTVDTALAAAKETIGKQAKYKSSLPKPTAKAPAKAKKALTAKWKKLSKKNQKKVTGFQVQIATNKTFTKNAKIYTVKGKAKTSKKIKSLKAKKTYYVRVRTYKSADGVKTVGKWSAVKKIKTK